MLCYDWRSMSAKDTTDVILIYLFSVGLCLFVLLSLFMFLYVYIHFATIAGAEHRYY